MALSTEDLKKAIIEKAKKAPKPQLYIKDFTSATQMPNHVTSKRLPTS